MGGADSARAAAAPDKLHFRCEGGCAGDSLMDIVGVMVGALRCRFWFVQGLGGAVSDGQREVFLQWTSTGLPVTGCTCGAAGAMGELGCRRRGCCW